MWVRRVAQGDGEHGEAECSSKEKLGERGLCPGDAGARSEAGRVVGEASGEQRADEAAGQLHGGVDGGDADGAVAAQHESECDGGVVVSAGQLEAHVDEPCQSAKDRQCRLIRRRRPHPLNRPHQQRRPHQFHQPHAQYTALAPHI